MTEVRMVPGAGYITPTADGEVKQVPGAGYITEEAAPVGGVTIPIFMHHYTKNIRSA